MTFYRLEADSVSFASRVECRWSEVFAILEQPLYERTLVLLPYGLQVSPAEGLKQPFPQQE